MAAIGGRILQLRTRLDRTRSDLAELLGVRPETVAMWESGRGIDRAAVNRIADRTGAAAEWLIAGFTPPELASIFAAANARSGGSRQTVGSRQ